MQEQELVTIQPTTTKNKNRKKILQLQQRKRQQPLSAPRSRIHRIKERLRSFLLSQEPQKIGRVTKSYHKNSEETQNLRKTNFWSQLSTTITTIHDRFRPPNDISTERGHSEVSKTVLTFEIAQKLSELEHK